MVYKFFDKKTRLGGSVNEELVQKLHKAVIKKLKIFGQQISFNRGDKYLLCAIVFFFIKYAWVKPLKDEKAKTVFHGFVELVNES